MYEKIKHWHEKGWWTESMVAQAVAKGLISEKQHKEIVGEGTENE